MSIRLPPHILACIDWNNPLEDPLRRQFIPLKAAFEPDHPKTSLDSLHEKEDFVVEGLVHRYTDKVLMLGEFRTPPSHITYYQVLTCKYSNIPLPPLLPLLHSFVFRRCQHPHGPEMLSQTHRNALGRNARLHSPHFHCPRRRRLRGRFLLPLPRQPRLHWQCTPFHAQCSTLPHRNKRSMRRS